MSKKNFTEKVMSNFVSKKGIDEAYKFMKEGSSPTKRKYFKVGNIIGYIKVLEKNISQLAIANKALKKEIGKLTKQLSKYNLNSSPNGVEGYIFFDQDEYNGLKHLETDMEQIIHDVKKDIIRKYWSSQLASYAKG